MEKVIDFSLSMGAKSLASELLEFTEYSTETASVSAWIQARNKIKPEAFQKIFLQTRAETSTQARVKGYCVLAHDGSDLNIEPDPLHPELHLHNQVKTFQQLHLNALYNPLTKQYLACDFQHRKKINEGRCLCEMADTMTFDPKTILLADRGYESFNVFEHLRKAGLKFLIRAKDIKSTGFLSNTPLPTTDTFDTTISLILTHRQTKEVRASPEYHFLSSNTSFDYLPYEDKRDYPMTLRVVRIETEKRKYEALLTNLEASEFSAEELKQLYHMRWGIETAFRELKYALGLSFLHSKKLEAIQIEIYARLIMSNFSMQIALSVLLDEEKKQRKYHYQINFTQAFGICRAFFKFMEVQVERLIQRAILPVREGRSSQRKMRQKGFIGFNHRLA